MNMTSKGVRKNNRGEKRSSQQSTATTKTKVKLIEIE